MEKSNLNIQTLVNVMLFRKPFVSDDFQITSTELIVRKDCYSLRKINQIELRQLSLKDNLVNIVTLALVLSAATWAFVPPAGIFVFAASLLLSFVSLRKYELRAEFRATDETGDHWVPIVRCCTEDEYSVLKELQSELQRKL
ncbi:DUF6232 family protein [Photobacterium lipolyticum]|uniref:Uncharacterized protein n=1 Tax=Photobacterium lipolyticum TaxID=266810 RepID=A0A2T3N0E6_9GAMM|nr:DUF6232 family protein [Photobacterium lipolyticum]PSW05739.1 hypothetical protein C9I89_08380 [Photobacterium lipolyticum]